MTFITHTIYLIKFNDTMHIEYDKSLDNSNKKLQKKPKKMKTDT